MHKNLRPMCFVIWEASAHLLRDFLVIMEVDTGEETRVSDPFCILLFCQLGSSELCMNVVQNRIWIIRGVFIGFLG